MNNLLGHQVFFNLYISKFINYSITFYPGDFLPCFEQNIYSVSTKEPITSSTSKLIPDQKHIIMEFINLKKLHQLYGLWHRKNFTIFFIKYVYSSDRNINYKPYNITCF